jgi:hypothetical protein
MSSPYALGGPDLGALLALGKSPIEVLNERYPAVYRKLMALKYDEAAPTIIGRCYGPATMFLDIDHLRGMVRAWVYDAEEEEFIGNTYEVFGPLGAAVERAHFLVSATLDEDQISGSADRSDEQVVEQVFVT